MTRLRLLLIPSLLGLVACESATLPGNPLPRPATLTSTALDGRVMLEWSEESYQAAPSRFDHYTVYSASYDFDADLCVLPWLVEGTTVGPSFVVSAMVNGMPRCFSVTATTNDQIESTRSITRVNTPRFQGQGLAWSVRQDAPATAGFRLWRDDNQDGSASRGELGRIFGASADVDFVLERYTDGRLYIVPSRAQTDLQVLGTHPVSQLAPIGEAPQSGYSSDPLEAVAGWAYLFRTVAADGYYRFGALRVLYVSDTFILVDWALQTDPGNPMLVRASP